MSGCKLLFCLIIPGIAVAGRTDLWDHCGCEWVDWQSWGDCSNECNGQHYRHREVRLYTKKDGCKFDFTTCATSGSGTDVSRCNTFCHNGGTSDTYSCSCVTGFYGRCCKFQIDCGDPGGLRNGHVHGTRYTYGSHVSYSCSSGYLLTDGSSSRTCSILHTWTGQKPRCAYYNSCKSGPCKNGATCSNIPDDYICDCSRGWSDKNCETDIQPPLMADCSNDLDIVSSDLITTVEWTKPAFSDLHNFKFDIASNYPENKWDFPWGNFNVSYYARKPSNGLSTECIFQIRVRPNTCSPLNLPLNSAIVCSNWKQDYGQFCFFLCQQSYTVPRGVNPHQWYICGASGSWIPGSTLPNCSVQVDTLQSRRGYIMADNYLNCTVDKDKMKKHFITKLKSSSFNYFCDKFSKECSEVNVSVKC